MRAKQRTQAAEVIELRKEAFGDGIRSYTHEALLENGVLVNVTSWVCPEMPFREGRDRWRVHATVTARLWQTLHKIPAQVRFFQTVRSRGHDVLWIASWALSQARKVGLDCVYFQAVLPTSEREEDCKTLRVEYQVRKDGGRDVTIGFPDEFPVV